MTGNPEFVQRHIRSDADILADTHDYIAEHGWTQHTMRDNDGKVCGYGGVAYSQGWQGTEGGEVMDNELQDMARRVLTKVLIAAGIADKNGNIYRGDWRPADLTDFTNWNDDDVEDQQVILDAFAKAEKIERAGYDPDA